jgi:hypothetical protein
MKTIPVYRRKAHIYILVFFVIVAIVFSTGLWKRIYVFSLATLQGSTIIYSGYKIHLGQNYVYVDSDDKSIEVQRVLPWFEDLEQGNSLIFDVRKPGDFEELKEVCSHDSQNCEVRSAGNYIARTHLLKASPEFGPISLNQFHCESCNVYIWHMGKPYAQDHRAFIDRFFMENCT